MTELSVKCFERCEYGARICAGPDHFCQLRRDELLQDTAGQDARRTLEDCLEPYGHAAHGWTTDWGPRRGEPRWCPGSGPLPDGANMMNRHAADEMQEDARKMLHRLTDPEARLSDPVYAAQVHFTEQTVRVLTEALMTTGVSTLEVHRVVEKFVLGMLPSTAQSQALRDTQNLYAGLAERGPVRP